MEYISCSNCVNKWCSHNGIYKTVECKDYYPRTYVIQQKGLLKQDLCWFDDRQLYFKFELCKFDEN